MAKPLLSVRLRQPLADLDALPQANSDNQAASQDESGIVKLV
jgi:hypothetical protein